MKGNSSPRLAFFACAYNVAEVAETTRAIEVAHALRDRGAQVQFLTHGGPHESHIVEAGFRPSASESPPTHSLSYNR